MTDGNNGNPETGWRSIGPKTISDPLLGKVVKSLEHRTEEHPCPVSGRANGIAFVHRAKKVTRVYLATSNGGVWQREFDAANGTWEKWRPKMDGFAEDPEAIEKGGKRHSGIFLGSDSLACGAIARVGAAGGGEETLYVGTGEGYLAHDSYFGVGPVTWTSGGWKQERLTAAGTDATGRPSGIGFYQIATNKSGSIVLGATSRGLHKRDSAAGTWKLLAFGERKVTSVVAAGDDGPFYAAVEGPSGSNSKVYRSQDGVDWRTDTGLPHGTGRISLAVVPKKSPKVPEVVYAVVEKGQAAEGELWRRNGTGGWEKVPGWPPSRRDAVKYKHWADSRLWYALAIAVDRQNQFVYMGGVRVNVNEAGAVATGGKIHSAALFRVDVGEGASTSKPYTYIGASVHADVHALELDEAGGLWVCCDGGLFWCEHPTGVKKDDDVAVPVVFTSLNDGLATATLQHLGQDPRPGGGDTLYCGSQDNGLLKKGDGATWANVGNLGDSGAAVVNWGEPGKVLISSSQSSLYRIDAAGGIPVKIADVPCGDKVEYYPPLAGTPFNPAASGTEADDQANLVAFGADKVWISTDFGTSWPTSLELPSGEGKVTSLCVASAGQHPGQFYLFAGTSNGNVYRFLGTRATWGERQLLGWPAADADHPDHRGVPVTCIAVDPADAHGESVYITLGGKVGHLFPRVCHHDGSSWTARCGPEWRFNFRDTSKNSKTSLLPVQHNAIVVHPDYPRRLYVAADIGVWRSNDGGNSWEPLSHGLPEAAVLDLKIHPETPPDPQRATPPRRLLRAATHGRGAFERDTLLEFVDILCVVDGRSLAAEVGGGGTAATASALEADAAAKHCRMVTRADPATGGAVKLRAGDYLRWRATSLTADETGKTAAQEEKYTVELVEFGFDGATTPLREVPQQNPLGLDLFEAEVGGGGQSAYTLTFKVTNGSTERFYAWPARIESTLQGSRVVPMGGGAASRDDIDILCVVDGRTLFEDDRFRDATHPDRRFRLTGSNGIGRYCRMITRNGPCLRYNNDHKLEITARNDTEIRWRALSLTQDSEYKVEIDGFYGVDESLYSKPTPETPGSDVYLSRTDSTRKGEDNYYVNFTVELGGKKRYFDWDPLVKVE